MLSGNLVSLTSLFLILECQCWSFFRSPASTDFPTPVEVAKSVGYHAETHSVRTEDGYILTMHRLLNPNLNLKEKIREPFILQHGLFCNSALWMVLEPKRCLPFMLADNGFDVWMTNIRGTMFSRQHERLSTDTAEFWNYSWHEHGMLDMPTMIDYILYKTNHKQVWYAGHSMGTTMFFVMNSMRPEYNKKIRHMFALSPVAYMSNLRNAVRYIAPEVRLLAENGRRIKNHLETDVLWVQFVRLGVCQEFVGLCAGAGNVALGYNPKANSSVYRRMLLYAPDYASVGQLAHYGQLINTPFQFRMYDYYERNLIKYNALKPPRYPVEKITAPMTFFYSNNDQVSAPVDVEEFSKNLQNVRMYKLPDQKFNHIDYLSSTYADKVVYGPMLEMIENLRKIGQ